jgi:hypothetical protein
MTATWQPALLTGPFDWDPAETPVRAFQERVARALALADADGLLVCGDRAEFGALAWLTGFVAKLGPALASFTPDGVASLWFSGGPGMAASARKLTWVDNVRSLGAPARDFSALAGQRIALWGEAVMPASLFAAITAVPVELVPMDVELDGLRRCKSSGELVLLRRASGILQSVAELLRDELRCGTRLGGAVLAAERHGFGFGAQEIRIMASRQAGGPPLPVDDLMSDVLALPVTFHVALRFGLYWAQGWFATDIASSPPDGLSALRPGTMAPGGVCGIGLSLAEAPFAGDFLAEGDVICLRGQGGSAMAVVGSDGATLLV